MIKDINTGLVSNFSNSGLHLGLKILEMVHPRFQKGGDGLLIPVQKWETTFLQGKI